jgi:hypothetical protein
VPLVAACFLVAPALASAQAFLPSPGQGDVTVSYQNLHARGHLDLNGDRMGGGSCCDPIQSHSMMWGLDFGVSRRMAVSVSLPFIASKYGGSTPHLVGGVGAPQQWDDGTYHGAFQDFVLGARVNVKARPVAITPFAEVIIPSHHYASLAHAAVGKDLRALSMGASVGGFLDAVTPGLFFQARVSYMVTQALLDIRPNRTRVDAEVGYFATPRVSVRFIQSSQVTHAGLDLIAFSDPMTVAQVHGHPEIPFPAPAIYRRNHDRLQRSDYLNLGGGVGFAVTDSLDLFAAAANTVWGKNVHPLRGLSVGANFHFSGLFGRGAPSVGASRRGRWMHASRSIATSPR